MVDAYIIFCLSKFYKLESYCEIGVWQGATLSLILDTNPDCQCLVIDPKPDLNFLASKVTLSKTKVVIGKSQEYAIEKKHFDFILMLSFLLLMENERNLIENERKMIAFLGKYLKMKGGYY